MEMHQITCDNLGMTRDISISSLSKGEDGVSNYAFENHNIRILAVNDNTKFSVTNEKSTKYEGYISGIFLGGCTCGRYLVLFMKDAKYPSKIINKEDLDDETVAIDIVKPIRRARPIGYDTNSIITDVIYRLEFTGEEVKVVELYRGDLGFDLEHPIEALGYYESEEVQKVYWVDGLNKNRYINIVYEKYFYNVKTSAARNAKAKSYYYYGYNIKLKDAVLYGLCTKDKTVVYWVTALEEGVSGPSHIWKYMDLEDVIITSDTTLAELPSSSVTSVTKISSITYQYNDYSFDFQGRINYLPQVTVNKDYNLGGTFQAGVIQYFITYYKKYGTESCIVWSSDLQYLSFPDRGGKADEAISCGIKFSITNLEEDYDFLRVYACYRSGLNGVVSSRIVTDIELENKGRNSIIKFTDLGDNGTTFNSDDIFYLGGQDIRVNTLDYKQDTLFLGDIKVADAVPNIDIKKHIKSVSLGNLDYTTIMNPGRNSANTCVLWAYKYVSSVASKGLYQYDQEIEKSQERIAGFKWREFYRFGIQFMDNDGAWTSAFWIGDDMCSLAPRVFTSSELNRAVESEFGDYVKKLTCNNSTIGRGDNGTSDIYILKDDDSFKEGCYIATPILDIAKLNNSVEGDISAYIAYRLLVADTNITNRRIIEQGVINPTMFNYIDRTSNRPFSIPSWIFRPKGAVFTYKHYDTLPEQTSQYAELQGITEKRIPGTADVSPSQYMNSYVFIIAANSGTLNTGYIQWKLIYYNNGMSSLEKADKLALFMYPGYDRDDGDNISEEDYTRIANILYKYRGTGIRMKKKGNRNPGADDDLNGDVAGIKGQLKAGYVPIHIYGYNYKVISGHIYDNDSNHTLSYYSTLREKLVELLTEDMRNTKADVVGEELAGKIVLSESMLPDEDLLKRIGNESDVNGAVIGAAIMAALVAAAAVVLSALSFGTLAPVAATAASAACSFAASVCALGSVGLGAAAATESLRDDLNDLTKDMLSLGYLPIDYPGKVGDSAHTGDYNLSARQKRALSISYMLEKMFTPDYSQDHDGTKGYIMDGSDKIICLYGESSDFDDENGNVPFTCGHPYTERGHIGEYYNAFMLSGKLSDLNSEEADKRNKQNVFCVDESIVTLNAPDVEDIYSAVNDSESLRLDLVGIVPINATYGIYNMSVGQGLNSSSQVLQGRFNTTPMGVEGVSARTAAGILNGYLYQDFFPGKSIESSEIRVNESIESYKVFMWNRKSAGQWFPGRTYKSPVDGSAITSPRSIIQQKVFANMRYSKCSYFHTPFSIDNENPIVCLDSQVALKTFRYDNDTKNYYTNVDTISVNSNAYPMVISGSTSYPQDEAIINNCALKDPVQIRYKETPHILVPFKWNTFTMNVGEQEKEFRQATILPRLESEYALVPSDMYSYKELLGVHLYGTTDVDIPVRDKFIFICYHYADPWQEGQPSTHHYNPDLGLNEQGYLSEKQVKILMQNTGFSPFISSEHGGKKTPINYLLFVAKHDESTFISSSTFPSSGWYTLSPHILGHDHWWYYKRIERIHVNMRIAFYDYKVDGAGYFDDATGKIGNAVFIPGGDGSNEKWHLEMHNTSGGYYQLERPYVTTNNLLKTVYSVNGNYGKEFLNRTSMYLSMYPKDTVEDTAVMFVSNHQDDSVQFVPLKYGNSFLINGLKRYKWNPSTGYLGDNQHMIEQITNTVKMFKYNLETGAYYKNNGQIGNYAEMFSPLVATASWKQDVLNWKRQENIPYLFLGELVRKSFNYNDWNGGTSDTALKQLVWNVASKATPISDNILYSWGDTFYQRWDCEKTYPFTEEEVNSNVEVLSFMLESHLNLDGRCDVNRGIHNLLNTRPSNTIYNNVYSQKDNFFTYQVLDEKFSKEHFEADVVWSLTKNNLDTIDKWTCLVSTNEMSLDGRYGPVRKILNVNDVLVAFQETGIASIRYNETAALNTTSGLPLQMGNTGKVEGYRMISDTIGCRNKFSISKNSAGVFFADDYNKSFNQFTSKEGIIDLSVRANFSTWFKKHLTGKLWTATDRSNFRVSYDEITHDLYIISNNECLVYNTLLQRFTSFMDYLDTPIIARMISSKGESKVFSFRDIVRSINYSQQRVLEVWQMFAGASDAIDPYSAQGAYGYIYGEFRPYSMEYRLNPDPMHDSIFTNYQYVADWVDPDKEVDSDNIFDNAGRRYTTFDTVEAKNEYQQGIIAIQQKNNIAGSAAGLRRVFGRQPIKSMFRLWRGDIPRDKDTLTGHTPLSDRMRNPWIHLKFAKTAADDSKMTFHNLIVNYYNQYGRY